MPDDTYKMDFGREYEKLDYKVVRSVTAYADALQDVFTEVTGCIQVYKANIMKNFKDVYIGLEPQTLEENVPTNPKLWSRAKALAKSKFDVYPSAYANGFETNGTRKRRWLERIMKYFIQTFTKI